MSYPEKVIYMLATPTLDQLLERSAALHRHLCPRQVLGVRMGMWAGELLALELPQQNKRLLTIVETDGCFCDGVAVAANCWVGRRTMRVEDYGKVAATFVDTKTGAAWRIAPHSDARSHATAYAPEATNRWQAMLLGYQRMPDAELLIAQPVELVTPIGDLVSRAGVRAHCARCGEEIINAREVQVDGETLCRACAGDGYYRGR
ncbi:MAG: TraR/DksA C4-type zinc finger protein [Caldilineaceae bacterium]|nr:TraR/DksA C4-type zinc finger protein [Caldilineaceae bacterium]